MAGVGDTVLSFHSRVHKFLGGLLKLLLRGLRVGVGHDPSLILDLDVDGESLGIGLWLLLALGTLIASVHGVVHHASVEGVAALLLLVLIAGDDGAPDDAEGTRVLGLALLLQLGAALDGASHRIAALLIRNAPRRVLFHLLVILGHDCVLAQSASKLRLITPRRRLTIVFLFIVVRLPLVRYVLVLT